jgi:hypothetical protein
MRIINQFILWLKVLIKLKNKSSNFSLLHLFKYLKIIKAILIHKINRFYSKNIKKPFRIHYDPFTQSIKIIDKMSVIKEIKKNIDYDIELILESMEALNQSNLAL